jgi:hypothetical protein
MPKSWPVDKTQKTIVTSSPYYSAANNHFRIIISIVTFTMESKFDGNACEKYSTLHLLQLN